MLLTALFDILCKSRSKLVYIHINLRINKYTSKFMYIYVHGSTSGTELTKTKFKNSRKLENKKHS